MITLEEIGQAFKEITAFYPTFYKDTKDAEDWQGVIKAWHEIFKNYDAKKFKRAIFDYIKQDKLGRPPWPGILLQLMYNGEIPERRFVQTGTDELGLPIGRHEEI